MKRLPAEWESQDAVILTWPHEKTDWLPMLARVEACYLTIVDILLRYVNVVIISHPDIIHTLYPALQKKTAHHRYSISIYIAENNDTWTRDHGPITIENGSEKQLLDFTFNGWGDKFESMLDNQINRTIWHQGAFGKTKLKGLSMVLEGGAIESDGQGCLLTTSTCLLNANRNPQCDKTTIETQLCESLGVKKILWLEHGRLAGDDTDSHIDTLARFAPENVIAHVQCDDPADEHFAVLQKMVAQLRTFLNCDGESFTLIPLPWPSAKYDRNGQRLPATYANFLVTNDAVLVPTYNDKNDLAALQQMELAFPGRHIHGVDCSVLLEQSGSLHCISMQIPTIP